jgi:hypothetical protein
MENTPHKYGRRPTDSSASEEIAFGKTGRSERVAGRHAPWDYEGIWVSLVFSRHSGQEEIWRNPLLRGLQEAE